MFHEIELDPWLKDLLVCPVDGSGLTEERHSLVCPTGHRFPIVEGIPVFLRGDVPATHHVIGQTLRQIETHQIPDDTPPAGSAGIDPVVQAVISATSGHLYQSMIGRLKRYPIPALRLPEGRGRSLLDLGCNWGRWTVAAARKGYRVVGIDPDLGAVLAARRVARQLSVNPLFVVGDARYLPFTSASFDTVFSYSVIQHFSKKDARRTIAEISRVLTREGLSLIQMPNANGVRSTYHRLRNPHPAGFDVRYWKVAELERLFEEEIGPTKVGVDGFFGLGIQGSDIDLVALRHKLVIIASEIMRKAASAFPPLRHIADSLYVTSRPNRTTDPRRVE